MLVRSFILLTCTFIAFHAGTQPLVVPDSLVLKFKPFNPSFQEGLKKTDSTRLGSVYLHPRFNMPVLVPYSSAVAAMPSWKPASTFHSGMPVINPLRNFITIRPVKQPEATPVTPPNRQ
ncbi:MAG TPA: hypothetical protein PKE63_02115 [Lacibacter sp.]|nr:hypothetical protein [Lacibacter sp.]HMO87597.1 hypothetical protein [Lacibacter sp.]HMP86040.1 hypothetical protein [Lacibacter sp.]